MPPLWPPPKKPNIFFVDTKSTCFLCLQETTPEDPPPPESTSILQEEDEEEGLIPCKREGDEKAGPFSLRRIFKLLQLDSGRIFREKLAAGPFLGSGLGNTDLSVGLCSKCLRVSRHLATLFGEWEILQMRLEQALGNFAGILQKSEDDPDRMAGFKRQFSDPFDMLYGSITQLIRKETLESCTKQLERFPPRVRLRRTPANPDAPVSSTSLEEHPCHGCGAQFRLRHTLFEHEKYHCKTLLPQTAGPPAPKRRFSFKCRVCLRDFSNHVNYMRHKRLQFCTAPQQPSPVVPGDPPSSPGAPNKKPGNVFQPVRCKHCDRLCLTENSVRFHERKHCDRLPLTSRRRDAVPLNDQGAPEYLKCDKCGDEFSMKGSLTRHVKKTCIYRLPPSEEEARQEEEESARKAKRDAVPFANRSSYQCCPDCGKYFFHTSLARHRKGHCAYRHHKTATTGPGVYKCLSQDCGEEYPLYSRLREHIAQDHIARKKCECGLYCAYMEPHIRRQVCTVYREAPPPQEEEQQAKKEPRKSRKRKSVPKPPKFPCQHCGLLFSSSRALEGHQGGECAMAKAALLAGGTLDNPVISGGIMEEDEEEEAVELYEGVYNFNTSKIEVLDLSPVLADGVAEMAVDAGMILPDIKDPLWDFTLN